MDERSGTAALDRLFSKRGLSFGTTSQALRASSPGRRATGESVVVVLDEQSFPQSGTTGLRCLDSRLLAQHSLVERSSAVAANENRARCLAPNLSPSEQQGLPGLPRVVLPLSLFATSPSGRRESFLSGELSAKQTERFIPKASPFGRAGAQRLRGSPSSTSCEAHKPPLESFFHKFSKKTCKI